MRAQDLKKTREKKMEKNEEEDTASETQKLLARRCSTWPKVFNFYHGLVQQKLKVYQTTPERQVLMTITKLLKKHLTEAEILQIINRIYFLDDEGIPVVFNVEAMPNDIKLFVQFPEDCSAVEVKNEKESNDSSLQQSAWRWDEQHNEKFCSYKISNQGLTVETEENSEETNQMPLLISDRRFEPDSGVFRFKISFEGSTLYTQIGIIFESELKNIQLLSQFSKHSKEFPLFQKYSVMGEPDNEFLVDCFQKELQVGKLHWKGLDQPFHLAIAIRKGAFTRAKLEFIA